MNLKDWLRKKPAPAQLRVDGKLVMVGISKQKWSEAEQTILSMGGEQVEALGGDGHVIRATSLEPAEDTTEETKDGKKKKDKGAEVAQICEIIAGAINQAADNAAKRHGEAYSLAFQENTKLVGLLAERLTGVERAYETLRLAQAGTQEDQGLLREMLTSFMSGAAQGSATNGKRAVAETIAKKVVEAKGKETSSS